MRGPTCREVRPTLREMFNALQQTLLLQCILILSYILMARHEHMPVFLDLYKLKNNKFWEELIAHFFWYDTGHIENDASKNSSIVTCVFVTAVTCLSRNDRGIFTEPLPSNDRVFFTEPLPSNDKGTFTEPLPSNHRGDTHTATLYHKPTFNFFK
jgi:hypothetical protein